MKRHRIDPVLCDAIRAELSARQCAQAIALADAVYHASNGRLRPEVADVCRHLDAMLDQGVVSRRIYPKGTLWSLA